MASKKLDFLVWAFFNGLLHFLLLLSNYCDHLWGQ